MSTAPSTAPSNRRRLALLVGIVVALAVALAGLTVVLMRNGDADHTADKDATTQACPSGYSRLHSADPDAGADGDADKDADQADSDHDKDADEDADKDKDKDAALGPCWKDGAPLPEQLQDLTSLNSSQSGVMGYDTPGSMIAAEKQAASLKNIVVANSRGTWRKISSGTLDETNTSYVAGGYGNTQLAGRMSGYALGPNGTVYGGVANGGVWKSTDQGSHWTDISVNLPSQIVGAIAWTKAGGARGTLLALTGDNSFGQFNWSGRLFYSTDEGRHWRLAKGIPGGLLAFKVTVAPDSPNTVYAATGSGLFRSTNAGRSFVNVKLPTVKGCVQHPFIEKCALSSIVTDVVVRGKDKFGHTGGAVVAAVGWRAGNQKNADGTPQAPANGLYESANGKPGSFKKLGDSSGFTPANRVGRVSFGDAYGPDQNHDYLYALVQDAALMQKGGIEVVPDQLGNGVTANNIVTYINGAYVSKDFGKTWTEMENTEQFIAPTTGSSLAALEPLGEAPGIQSWYNNWIQPDPYAQLGGVPTDVLLGMEEIWQTSTNGTPQTGATDFQVVAPYAGGTYVCVIVGSACTLTLQKSKVTSAHPDQHGILFLPGKSGSRKILATSDGGNYSAPVPLAGLFKQTDFTAHQAGFNTLVPYAFDVSKDGTVVDGMQDNGSLIWHPGDKIAEETYPGDGGTTLIDPSNSKNAIISLAIGAELFKSTTGGKGTSVELDSLQNEVSPDVGTRYTYGELGRDLAKPTRIIYGGRQIAVADTPIADLTTSSWKTVYDLGTRLRPGVASAKSSANNPELQDTANDIYNDVAYVGYCGACQTITGLTTPGTGGKTFASGIATNYGGKWHIARAKGLPHRLVNTLLVDHSHQNIVYAGLGVSTKRQAFHPGVTGHDGVSQYGGFLYKSTDGGKTFHDVTGNLPRVGVLSLAEYRGQLLVGSTLGAYISRIQKSVYARLGKNLPAVAVSMMKFRPGHPQQLYVSTFGRGIYRLTLRRNVPDPALSRLRITHKSGKLMVSVRLRNHSATKATQVTVQVTQNGKFLARTTVPLLSGRSSRILEFSSPYRHLGKRTISVVVYPTGTHPELSKSNDRVTKTVEF